MKELFPFTSLSPKQTVIVSELLRDHPQGRVENHDGKPVFVSEAGASAIQIPLSESNRSVTNGGRAAEAR
ncbi:MAG: hypothetical protein ABIZ04_24975 [Opitutus sp.]